MGDANPNRGRPVRIRKSWVPVLAVPFSLALLGCSSVKAEKGPFKDDDWPDYEPGNGNVPGNSGGTGVGAGGTGGSSAGGTGGGGAGTGGSPGTGTGGSDKGCQTFDYANYRAPAAAISLKTDIVPIFQGSCSLSSSCHSDKSMQPPRLGPSIGMVDAAGLQTIRAELLAASPQVPALKFVSPGKPEESYLMNKIDGTWNCMGFACRTADGCGVRMPQLLQPLETEKVNKIRDWIKQGAAAM